jgi:superfamily I DNA/RNA helicase
MFGKALETRGILHNWVSEDYRSKRSYDVTTNSVTISTVHSAKGFDYERVFLVGLDLVDPLMLTDAQARRMAYVGATRARYQLFIPFVHKTDLISHLLGCLDTQGQRVKSQSA